LKLECNKQVRNKVKSPYIKIGTFILLIISISNSIYAQNITLPDPNFKADNWYLETTLGLSYMWEDLAVIDNTIDLDQATTAENSLRFKALFRGSYTLIDQLMFGAHAGFGYLSYDILQAEVEQSFQNYILGLHLRYYVDIHPKIAIFVETGANQNFFTNGNSFQQDYQKWYTNLGLKLRVDPKWWLSIHFNDILYYYSDSPNFEDRSDFGVGKPMQDFINFPTFGVMYQLN